MFLNESSVSFKQPNLTDGKIHPPFPSSEYTKKLFYKLLQQNEPITEHQSGLYECIWSSLLEHSEAILGMLGEQRIQHKDPLNYTITCERRRDNTHACYNLHYVSQINTIEHLALTMFTDIPIINDDKLVMDLYAGKKFSSDEDLQDFDSHLVVISNKDILALAYAKLSITMLYLPSSPDESRFIVSINHKGGLQETAEIQSVFTETKMRFILPSGSEIPQDAISQTQFQVFGDLTTDFLDLSRCASRILQIDR